MSKSTRSTLMGVVLALMIAVIFTQAQLDPQVRDIHKGEKTAFQGLSNEFVLGPLLGLQQAAAGLLWVRADEFFHEGDYDAILPIVRMVTWLDPHQLDVYITGAWHLAYNFTDSAERSDRRYIPAAQKLLEEGFANNDSVFDIAFELGWQNYDKIKDYQRADYWFRQGATRDSTDAQGRVMGKAPMFVKHMLAHALERQGRTREAIDVWRECLAESEAKLKKDPSNWSLGSVKESEAHNLRMNLERDFSRTKHQIDFELDTKLTKSINMETGEPNPRDAYLALDAKVDGVPVGTPRPPAVSVPWNTAFDTVKNGRTTITFPEPKLLELNGQFAIGDGARVMIRLHDDNWTAKSANNVTFDIDQSQTIMQDFHSVRGYKWGRKIDMGKDPKMYGFTRNTYYLVFEFDPRGTAPFIQDRIGVNGEALRDPKFLWTEPSPEPGKTPATNFIRKVYRLTREHIMGMRPVTEADVIPNAEYARVQAELQSKLKAETN